MATLTIRNLDMTLKARLRERAAQHGHSMAEEVRSILGAAVLAEPEQGTAAALVADIRAFVEPFDGIELTLPTARMVES